MMNAIIQFFHHPAPFAILGGVSMVLGLAQNEPVLMFWGFWGLIIALWNYEDSI